MLNNNKMQLLLIILVLVLGIGYAYINSDLNINGTAQVKHANWDVHWANVQVKTGSVTGSNVVTAPTIQNQTTVNYSVILSIPGDYYEFTVDAVNGGSIDAMIDTIDSKLNNNPITTLPAYLKYDVTYSSGAPLEPNHELKANTTETYKVRVEYRTDIELNQIPTTNQTLSLQFTVTYRQATEDATEVPPGIIVYAANIRNEQGQPMIGQAIPADVVQYSNPAGAIAALNTYFRRTDISFYFKHIIQNGVIGESYLVFIVTPEMAQEESGMTAGTYALKGEDSYSGIYYADNKAVLLQAFGSSRCTENATRMTCRTNNRQLQANCSPSGGVSAYQVTAHAAIESDGSSYCEYGD